MTREHVEAPSRSTMLDWGNSAPLALFAFAVTTFMLSMINANAINKGVEPVVFGVALMFGGITQLIAGIIQLRVGNTFAGVLFSGFGAFWMSLFAIVQWFLKDVPAAQVGHAQGLFLYAFGIFVVVMLAASLRTNVVVVLALAILVAVFFLLGAGNYGAHTTMIHWGGYTGLAAAACAFYLALAELCESSYGRAVLPIWPLAAR
ncbi:MAG: acetate uptake transporter [Solirubrobacteraceae bacterium]